MVTREYIIKTVLALQDHYKGVPDAHMYYVELMARVLHDPARVSMLELMVMCTPSLLTGRIMLASKWRTQRDYYLKNNNK